MMFILMVTCLLIFCQAYQSHCAGLLHSKKILEQHAHKDTGGESKAQPLTDTEGNVPAELTQPILKEKMDPYSRDTWGQEKTQWEQSDRDQFRDSWDRTEPFKDDRDRNWYRERDIKDQKYEYGEEWGGGGRRDKGRYSDGAYRGRYDEGNGKPWEDDQYSYRRADKAAAHGRDEIDKTDDWWSKPKQSNMNYGDDRDPYYGDWRKFDEDLPAKDRPVKSNKDGSPNTNLEWQSSGESWRREDDPYWRKGQMSHDREPWEAHGRRSDNRPMWQIREEEEQLARQKVEEERRLKEEEAERKRKEIEEAEERKKREEAERLRKEKEAEKKRLEEEERKRKEKEAERKKIEEEKRKEEERKKKEEEERKRKEEERKKKEEERKRKEEERKKKEQERKKKEEERKRKEELERQKKEAEERKRKEEERRRKVKEEAERKKREKEEAERKRKEKEAIEKKRKEEEIRKLKEEEQRKRKEEEQHEHKERQRVVQAVYRTLPMYHRLQQLNKAVTPDSFLVKFCKVSLSIY